MLSAAILLSVHIIWHIFISTAERVRITKPLSDMEVKEKDELILTCEVNKLGKKPVWFLDDEEIKPSDRIKTTSRGLIHKLTVESVKPHEEGKYTVAFGDIKASADVTVQGTFINTYHTMGRFGRRQIGDIFLIFPRK